MADSTWAKRAGVTPGRLIIIAVLAVVLVLALIFPMDEASEPTASPRRPQAREQQATPRAALHGSSSAPAATPPSTEDVIRPLAMPAEETPSRSSGEAADASQGLPMSVETACSYDPFAVVPSLVLAPPAEDADRDSAASAAAKRRQQTAKAMEALRDQGVQMVFIDKGEAVAFIGDRAVRIGDTIEGLQVTSIDAQGIVLSDVSDPDEQKPNED